MTSAAVSVVIPTRDREAFLLDATRSVLAQRDVDVEVIVVDDGSSRSCDAVLAPLGDGRVRVVRHDQPRGVAEARNTGIRAARAPWLAFLDDDDLLAPGSLAAHLAATHETPEAGWSCVGLVHIDRRAAIVGSSLPPDPAQLVRDLPQCNVVPAPSCVMVARHAVEAAGLFDPAFSCYADWDLWLRLAPQAPLVCVARPLAAYRYHDANMSSDPYLWDAERRRMAAKHGSAAATGPAANRAAWGRAHAFNYLHAGHARRSAQEMWRIGRRERDGKALVAAAAIRTSPATVRRLLDARSRRRVPADWRREAEAWLAPFRR